LSEIYKIGGIGTVPVGRIATGVFKLNMMVKFIPSNLIAKVKTIEMPGNIRFILGSRKHSFRMSR